MGVRIGIYAHVALIYLERLMPLTINSAHAHHNLLGHIIGHHCLHYGNPNFQGLVPVTVAADLFLVLAVGVRVLCAIPSPTVLG